MSSIAYDSFLVENVVATNGFPPESERRQELALIQNGSVMICL